MPVPVVAAEPEAVRADDVPAVVALGVVESELAGGKTVCARGGESGLVGQRAARPDEAAESAASVLMAAWVDTTDFEEAALGGGENPRQW